MRTQICIISLLFLGCNQQQTSDKNIAKIDTPKKVTEIKIELPTDRTERAKYHTDKDTVCIYSEAKDSLRFLKDEFNDIIDNFPELTSLNPKNPDTAYSSKISVELIGSNGEKKQISFGSEAGQDNYYILYAYFLKQKNGVLKFADRRKNLIEIYGLLNSIFSHLNHGGTYFSHQYPRIEGYAEFAIYWYRHYEDYYDRPYKIDKQKQFYIEGLKQLIADEINFDESTASIEKTKMKEELFEKVNKLKTLIKDNFYLRMAQSFKANYY